MLKNKRDKIYNNISLKDRLLQSNTYLPPAWMDINVFNFLLSFGKTCKSANVMTSRWRRHASRRRFWFDWTFKRRMKSSFCRFSFEIFREKNFCDANLKSESPIHCHSRFRNSDVVDADAVSQNEMARVEKNTVVVFCKSKKFIFFWMNFVH